MTRSVFCLLACCLSLLLIQLAEAQDTRRWESRFDELDRNQDGKVSPDELTRKTLFERLDLNRDGFITKVELKEFAARGESESSYSITRDIPYQDHDRNQFDLYVPKAPKADRKKPRPVMIYVHGGGWRIGDKSRVGNKAEFFCQLGWAFVSTNYRFVPQGKHPNNVQDVAACIAHVAKNAEEFGIDPKQIYLMGHSAGAHLVSLVATDHRHLEKYQQKLNIIKGVISLDTQAYDVVERVAKTSSGVYVNVFGKDLTLQKSASPINHVQSGKQIPPFLIAYSGGMSEHRKNPERARVANVFAEKLRSIGVSAAIADGSDRTHSQINQWFGKPKDKITAAAQKFLVSLSK
ncbi:MAG: alpha/beta hydrolase fold domain-containing protein [Planctomycetota bacterium]